MTHPSPTRSSHAAARPPRRATNGSTRATGSANGDDVGWWLTLLGVALWMLLVWALLYAAERADEQERGYRRGRRR